MPKAQITSSRLMELVVYSPETGSFQWKVPRPGKKNDSYIGNKHHTGYINISVDGVSHGAHRLAWLYTFGCFPPGQIDHINGIKMDNRICNLRLCNSSTNQANILAHRDGFKGVTKHSCGKFMAQIKHHGKNIYLGLFTDESSAAAAYDASAKKIFGDFAKLNLSEAKV